MFITDFSGIDVVTRDGSLMADEMLESLDTVPVEEMTMSGTEPRLEAAEFVSAPRLPSLTNGGVSLCLPTIGLAGSRTGIDWVLFEGGPSCCGMTGVKTYFSTDENIVDEEMKGVDSREDDVALDIVVVVVVVVVVDVVAACVLQRSVSSSPGPISNFFGKSDATLGNCFTSEERKLGDKMGGITEADV